MSRITNMYRRGLTKEQLSSATAPSTILLRLRDTISAARGRTCRDLPVMSSPPTLRVAAYRVNSTAYVLNDVVLSTNGLFYIATSASGTTGTTPPSGTGNGIADGTVTWNYLPATPSNFYGAANVASNNYLWEAGVGARLSAFRGLSGVVVNDGTSTFAKQQSVTVAGVRTQSSQDWETVADAQRITVRLFALDASQTARVLVNGQFVSLTPTTLKLGGGALLIEFASRAVRHVEVELSGGVHFGGFDVGLTETLNPAPGTPLWLGVAGDSFPAGAYAGTDNTLAADGFGTIAGELLGFRGVLNTGIGSTGLLVSSASGTARSRVSDLGYVPLHAVLEANGYNDTGSSAAAVQAEAELYIAAIRSTVGPNCPIFVIDSLLGNRGAGHAATVTVATGKLAAVAARRAAGDRLVFPIRNVTNPAGPWATGTGRVGAVAGNGNSDFYTSTDNIHNSLAGTNYTAGRTADAMAAAVDTALLELAA